MKKTLGIIIAAILVLAALAPGIIGRLSEKEYRRLLAQLSIHPLVRLSVISYERRWLGAKAITAMEVKVPGSVDYHDFLAEPFRLELIHDFSHGPFIFGGEAIVLPALLSTTTRLRLPAGAQTLAARIYGEQEPLIIESMRPFSGEHHFRFTASGATFTDADKGIVVVMQPAAGDWMVTGDLDACRGKLSWLGLTAGFGGRMVAVEGLSYAFDLERLDEHIWTGNGAFDLEHLGVRTADGSDFKLKSLHLDSDVREQDGLLNGKGRLSLARLIINELEYGPAGYAAQLHRLDAATVSDFYARQAAMYELLQGASPGEMAEAPGQFGNYLLELLPRLLKRGPALEIADLSFAAPAGVISGSAKLWVDESQPELLEQLATLPYALKADFRLELPRVLLSDSRFEPQVDAMLTAGLLEQRGELVSMHGRFVHGQLMLNDKPLPLVPTVSN